MVDPGEGAPVGVPGVRVAYVVADDEVGADSDEAARV